MASAIRRALGTSGCGPIHSRSSLNGPLRALSSPSGSPPGVRCPGFATRGGADPRRHAHNLRQAALTSPHSPGSVAPCRGKARKTTPEAGCGPGPGSGKSAWPRRCARTCANARRSSAAGVNPAQASPRLQGQWTAGTGAEVIQGSIAQRKTSLNQNCGPAARPHGCLWKARGSSKNARSRRARLGAPEGTARVCPQSAAKRRHAGFATVSEKGM